MTINFVALSAVAAAIETGKRPKGGVGTIEGGVWSLGGEHVGADGNLNLTNPRYVPIDFYKSLRKGLVKPRCSCVGLGHQHAHRRLCIFTPALGQPMQRGNLHSHRRAPVEHRPHPHAQLSAFHCPERGLHCPAHFVIAAAAVTVVMSSPL